MDNLRHIVKDFDNRVTDKPDRTKTVELQSDMFELVNNYIKENSLSGQDFILQALERTIIRNNINLDYLKEVVSKVDK